VNTYRLAGRSVDALLSLKKLSDVSKEQVPERGQAVPRRDPSFPGRAGRVRQEAPQGLREGVRRFPGEEGELTSPATVALIRNSVMKFLDASKVPRRRDSDRGVDWGYINEYVPERRKFGNDRASTTEEMRAIMRFGYLSKESGDRKFFHNQSTQHTNMFSPENPNRTLLNSWYPRIIVVLIVLLLFLPDTPVSSSVSSKIPIRLPEGNPFPTLPAMPGCFVSVPYTGVWTEVQCSYGKIQPNVGGGFSSYPDFNLSDSSSTTEGNGSISFPTYAGETNLVGSDLCVDNWVDYSTTYSLQLNTNLFTGANSHTDWVQFTSQVVDGGKAAVGIWEIDTTPPGNYDHNQTTTTSWKAPLNTTIEYYLNGGIVRSYYGTVFVETELYYVNYPSSGSDTTSTAYVVSISDTYGLSGNWHQGEMNVFGLGCGNEAEFNTGSSASPYLSFPVCNGNSVKGTTETGEYNNFNLGSSTTVSCSTRNTAYVYYSESI
jgi:hypothetical protein